MFSHEPRGCRESRLDHGVRLQDERSTRQPMPPPENGPRRLFLIPRSEEPSAFRALALGPEEMVPARPGGLLSRHLLPASVHAPDRPPSAAANRSRTVLPPRGATGPTQESSDFLASWVGRMGASRPWIEPSDPLTLRPSQRSPAPPPPPSRYPHPRTLAPTVSSPPPPPPRSLLPCISRTSTPPAAASRR